LGEQILAGMSELEVWRLPTVCSIGTTGLHSMRSPTGLEVAEHQLRGRCAAPPLTLRPRRG